MEKSSLIHYSDSIYSHALSKDVIELRLATKKDDDIKSIEVIYNDKYVFHENVKSKKIFKTCSDDLHDYYITRFKLKDKRFAYVYKITTLNNEVFYFSESGVTKGYDITKGFYDFFQVSYINEKDLVKVHEKFHDRVCYQIFVDRFYKSKDYTSERINIKWGDQVTSKSFAGGNLKGIDEKLDYLDDLGINALYLTPIFEAESNHKYDTIDYYEVSKDFGTNKDLKDLIEHAHKKGMMILLDGVFNHISYHSMMFQDVIKNGKKSRYYDWFFIHGETVDLKKVNYETFAFCYTLPKLNLNNEEVREYIFNVGRNYVIHYQIDGFRLDVSDEVPHDFWIEFKKEMLKLNPEFILIGENWHNASSFLNSGKEFDSIMNYSITKELLNFIAFDKMDSKAFVDRIYSNLLRYPSNVNYNLLNLLSTHDIDRFLKECKEDVDLYLLGYSFIFMHVGVPCLYYGDEIGLSGGYDPDNRRCFIWDESKWNKKINQMIKELISIHKNKKINDRTYELKEKDGLIYLKRSLEGNSVILIMNKSNKDIVYNTSSTVLLSNLYQHHILKNKGFIILEEDER